MMTTNKLRDFSQRRNNALQRLITPARAAIATLRDLKMESNARALEEVIFEMDAIEQEMQNCMRADPEGTVDAMMKLLDRATE